MTQKYRFTNLIKIGLLGLLCSSFASAATIGSDYQGWVNSAGGANGGINGNNTFTGNEFGNRYNSWANFDLSSQSGVVTGASLILDTALYPFNSNAVYTVGIYDMSTSLASLLSASSGVAGYNDMRSGSLYGSATVSAANPLVTVILSAQAVADINASLGANFRIGFTNDTLNLLNPVGVDIGVYTNGNQQSQPQLVLNYGHPTVPDSGSALLLVSFGLAGLGLMRRRAGR